VIAVKTGVAGGRRLPLDETRICGTFDAEGNLFHLLLRGNGGPRRLWHSNGALLHQLLPVLLHRRGLGRSLRDEGTGANDDGVPTKGRSNLMPVRSW
jgi:hypothetical protein